MNIEDAHTGDRTDALTASRRDKDARTKPENLPNMSEHVTERSERRSREDSPIDSR